MQTDRQIDIYIYIDRQIDKYIERQIDIQIDIYMYIERKREIDMQISKIDK